MRNQPTLSIRKKPLWWIGAFIPIMLMLAACQPAVTLGQAPQATKAPVTTVAPTSAPAATTPAEATINVVTDPKLGKILVGNKSLTLYVFNKDEPDKVNCTGKCLTNWPPLLTQGHPTLGDGVDASMIGTATLADGSTIVTYNHRPLYYFFKDKNPGDTTGQGVGNVWHVITPNGKPVGQEVTINVATDPKLGKILVDGAGMTLYMYTKDTPDTSTCSGKCAQFWPPLITQGHPTLGDGVNASMIGAATLADGSMIVTYNHMPLYYFVKDKKPGDTAGQGSQNVWYVVSPDGNPVGK